jgi:hypothetical protein
MDIDNFGITFQDVYKAVLIKTSRANATKPGAIYAIHLPKNNERPEDKLIYCGRYLSTTYKGATAPTENIRVELSINLYEYHIETIPYVTHAHADHEEIQPENKDKYYFYDISSLTNNKPLKMKLEPFTFAKSRGEIVRFVPDFSSYFERYRGLGIPDNQNEPVNEIALKETKAREAGFPGKNGGYRKRHKKTRRVKKTRKNKRR